MERAIALAASHCPHPNPRVGTVIVGPDGSTVGEGAHVAAGEPHAERIALAEAGERALGATVYVTLEPCAHHGRTSPCADALIHAGVARVVAAVVDPDHRVAGEGFRRMRNAGIDVEVGLGADAVEAMDPGYFHHRRTGMPRVTVKAALTLDGQMAGADRSSRWITDPEMRRDVAALRGTMDALVVGAGAVIEDDPSLDPANSAAVRPTTYVVAGRRPIPPTSRLVRAGAHVISPRYDPDGPATASPEATGDRVDLHAAFIEMAQSGALDIMVEGGPTLISGVVAAGLVARYVLYFGAKLGTGVGIPMFGGVFGRIEDAVEGEIQSVRQIGSGLRVDFQPQPRG